MEGNISVNFFQRINPPSQVSTWPVMKSASGEARNATAAAISAGVPSRPMGVCSASCGSSSGGNSSSISVWMTPGATQFTRMWLGASSAARERVRPIRAALVVD